MRITVEDMDLSCRERFAVRWPDGVDVTEETLRELKLMPLYAALIGFCPVAAGALRSMRERDLKAYDDAVLSAGTLWHSQTEDLRRELRAGAISRHEYDERIRDVNAVHRAAMDAALAEHDKAFIRSVVEAAKIHDKEVSRG